MEIEVSIGEIADKYTILSIKKIMIQDPKKALNINKEFDYIKSKVHELEIEHEKLVEELFEINKQLWSVEDKIRECERNKYFGEEFITLARSVYELNDIRSIIKKQINVKYNSDFVEEKSYEKY